jgi:hypothetical protein
MSEHVLTDMERGIARGLAMAMLAMGQKQIVIRPQHLYAVRQKQVRQIMLPADSGMEITLTDDVEIDGEVISIGRSVVYER